MDRFVLREPRTSVDYPPENQMIAFSTNGAGGNMVPQETIYFSGPFASEFPSIQPVNPAGVNVPYNMNAQHTIYAQHNMHAQHNTNAQHNTFAQQSINAQLSSNAQQRVNAQHNTNAQRTFAQSNMNAQHNTSAQHNTITQHNMNRQHNMTPHLGQEQSFGPNNLTGQSHVSGIDPRYLAGYTDNSAQYIIAGQRTQRNGTPINPGFGSDYQNRSFNGMDRNKQRNFVPEVVPIGSQRVEPMSKTHSHPMVGHDNKLVQNQQKNFTPQSKKTNELDLLRNDIQNQIVSRADKLKALYKTGPRAFSGPVEKVLKWHKSLQEIGVLVFYEIVAKCVSVRPGESCSKNLVVRDDNGPAMQIVYYEIDFLLPELKPPCTIRVIGRMMAGTCRLQAFNVRPATGDDVATLPRRAAVAAHHVAKLCKEYGPNTTH